MNKSIFFLLFVFSTLISCETDSIRGSKKIVKKTFNYIDFTKIDASNTFSVKLTQGKEYKVELSCNENILEFVDITQSGKTLNMKLEGSHSFSNISVKVNITVPTIEKIKASGASKIKMRDFKIDHLKIDLSGASSLKGSVKITNLLEVEASGASTIKLKGKVKNADFDISGASTLNAKDLIINEKLTIDASGASSCKITSRGTLEMESSGASSIDYYGTAKVIKSDESGAGSIEKKFKV